MSKRRLSSHHQAHYEYKVISFGLSNSPSIFQTIMNEVFREFLHRFISMYIDDILIYSRNWPNIVTTWRRSSNSSDNTVSTSKLEKCEFHRSTVQFLWVRQWPRWNLDGPGESYVRWALFLTRFNFTIPTVPETAIVRQMPYPACTP